MPTPLHRAPLLAVSQRGRLLARFVVTLVFLMPSVAPLIVRL